MRHRVLLVEDSPTQAEALRALLEEEEDYAVTVVGSGEEALEWLDDAETDLVLSDIMMPGITGYDLCRRIKDEPRLSGLPVMLLTTLGDPMDIVRGLECGADNYITKPYDPDQLLARVRRVLDNRSLRRQAKTTMGVNIAFLGSTFTITSEREQILDLLLSSVEDVVRTNRALEQSQRKLAEAHSKLESYAQEKAREASVSAERYRTLMQGAADAIFILDAAGTVLEANPRAADLLALPLEELLGRPVESFFAPGEPTERNRLLLLEPEDDGSTAAGEMQMLCSDGRVVEVEFSSSAITVDGERLIHVIMRDITERKETARQLEESQQRYRSLFSYHPDAVYSLSLEGKFLTANLACKQISGYAIEDLYHTSFEPLLAPEERKRVVEFFHRATQGEPQSYKTTIVHRDGHLVELHVTNLPIVVDDRIVGVYGIAKDVTQRRQAEEALQRSEEQLRQSQKMEIVGRLAGGIAHDFNNLLTAIKSNTYFVLSDLPEGTPMREDMQEIDHAVDRAAALTHHLLAFSRKQVLQPKKTRLDEAVSTMERMLGRVIGEHIRLVISTEPGLGYVEVDPVQIEQVLLNLALNARDAMPTGGRLTIETRNATIEKEEERLYPHLPRGTRAVELTVSDTGHGIPEEVRGRIFEPFFTTKPKGKGTGLGLSTVYGLVKQSGGYIWVDSRVGEGTTFTIRFPQVEEDRAEEASSAPAVTEPARGSESVLVVEDEPSIRLVVRRVLQKQGYTVLEAKDGEEALRALEEHPGEVHLLITDVVMPGMSGRELVRRVSELRACPRVLYMSGYSEDMVANHGILDPGVALIEKPFTPESLARRVREILGGEPGGVDPG
jgi:two-component system cell cycle sensor histidine kinase/response regulator CckA